jgi:hypothetical protein
VDCTTGTSYDKVVENVISGRVNRWASRECFPYEGDASMSCARADACASQLPSGENLVAKREMCSSPLQAAQREQRDMYSIT